MDNNNYNNDQKNNSNNNENNQFDYNKFKKGLILSIIDFFVWITFLITSFMNDILGMSLHAFCAYFIWIIAVQKRKNMGIEYSQYRMFEFYLMVINIILFFIQIFFKTMV